MNVWIPEKEKCLVEELKRIAKAQKMPLSDTTCQALREYVEKIAQEEKAEIAILPPWTEDLKRFMENHKELFTKALENLESGKYTPLL